MGSFAATHSGPNEASEPHSANTSQRTRGANQAPPGRKIHKEALSTATLQSPAAAPGSTKLTPAEPSPATDTTHGWPYFTKS